MPLSLFYKHCVLLTLLGIGWFASIGDAFIFQRIVGGYTGFNTDTKLILFALDSIFTVLYFIFCELSSVYPNADPDAPDERHGDE